MRTTITISLPPKLKRELDAISREEGVSRSDLIRDSLRRLILLRQFDALQAEMIAEARSKGIFTEDDVQL